MVNNGYLSSNHRIIIQVETFGPGWVSSWFILHPASLEEANFRPFPSDGAVKLRDNQQDCMKAANRKASSFGRYHQRMASGPPLRLQPASIQPPFQSVWVLAVQGPGGPAERKSWSVQAGAPQCPSSGSAGPTTPCWPTYSPAWPLQAHFLRPLCLSSMTLLLTPVHPGTNARAPCTRSILTLLSTSFRKSHTMSGKPLPQPTREVSLTSLKWASEEFCDLPRVRGRVLDLKWEPLTLSQGLFHLSAHVSPLTFQTPFQLLKLPSSWS